MTAEKVLRHLDENGYVIISQKFIHKQHVLNPLPKK